MQHHAQAMKSALRLKLAISATQASALRSITERVDTTDASALRPVTTWAVALSSLVRRAVSAIAATASLIAIAESARLTRTAPATCSASMASACSPAYRRRHAQAMLIVLLTVSTATREQGPVCRVANQAVTAYRARPARTTPAELVVLTAPTAKKMSRASAAPAWSLVTHA